MAGLSAALLLGAAFAVSVHRSAAAPEPSVTQAADPQPTPVAPTNQAQGAPLAEYDPAAPSARIPALSPTPSGRSGNPVLLEDARPTTRSPRWRRRCLECIVKPDGSVGPVPVRLLDAAFGPDQEAIKAAKKWRLLPGRLAGRPVAVVITILMEFNLHCRGARPRTMNRAVTV